MARIRSIKPEFFTSETLAAVSLSARLTFVGLWTYVDDNGVGLDNDRLITAALYALDGDPLETLRRVSDDLTQLSTAGVITRYESSGRRYLFVTNWLEHQKVSHPGKPRFPRPAKTDPKPPTSTNGYHHEDGQNVSGDTQEDLTQSSALSREQGAGSREGIREQGAGKPPAGGYADADPGAEELASVTHIHGAPDEPPAPTTTEQLVADWIDHVPKRPPGAIIGRIGKHIKTMIDEGIDPADIRRGVAAWAVKGKDPSTLPSIVNEVMNAGWHNGAPAGSGGARSNDAALPEAMARALAAEATGRRFLA